jgi:hypothetical protein
LYAAYRLQKYEKARGKERKKASDFLEKASDFLEFVSDVLKIVPDVLECGKNVRRIDCGTNKNTVA